MNIINNGNGGVVNILTPPNLPKRKRHFKRMLRIGKLRFYVTWDYRLKNSQTRDQNRNHNGIVQVKEALWKKHDGTCQMCGRKIDKFGHSQLHHVLQWWRFPQFESDERNLLLLCRDCHNEIHKDPLAMAKATIEKCEELGIDPKDYFNV